MSEMVERVVNVPDLDKLTMKSERTADGFKITATVPTSPAKVMIGADGQLKLVITAALGEEG